MDFKLRTTASGGKFYDSNYRYFGDVVLQGAGSTTSYATVSHLPNGDWNEYFIEFSPNDDACWSAGPATVKSILSNVTGLAIRAEFTTGNDETWLADFSLVHR